MSKTLKFPAAYISNILARDHGASPRMFDQQNLTAGDEIDFVNEETEEIFARAKITRIKTMTFETMADFTADPEALYVEYGNRYKIEIEPEMEVKIVEYELIK